MLAAGAAPAEMGLAHESCGQVVLRILSSHCLDSAMGEARTCDQIHLPSPCNTKQDTRRVQSCPLDSSAAGAARAAALLWRQKQFADFLGGQEVQVGFSSGACLSWHPSCQGARHWSVQLGIAFYVSTAEVTITCCADNSLVAAFPFAGCVVQVLCRRIRPCRPHRRQGARGTSTGATACMPLLQRASSPAQRYPQVYAAGASSGQTLKRFLSVRGAQALVDGFASDAGAEKLKGLAPGSELDKLQAELLKATG